ncbi:Thermopsin [Sulfolobus islandicus Y.G.57.14]|uniref:Thermopsin n=1 Tax=Saccharolobus islandicus (strain Y.G.57.14 / Yellowstone \|nr:thermopsin [Sulfolobus islandicus]ACP44845.1 Thermopsin [Sulfolobus islandicus Y.G.57.14]
MNLKILYVLLLMLFLISFLKTIMSSSLISYQPVALPPNYYEYYPLNVTSGQCIFFHVITTLPSTIMLFNQEQFLIFKNDSKGIPIYFNVSDDVSFKTSPLSTGIYYLVVLNNVSNNTITVNVEYLLTPVSVYYYKSSLPAPIGITDYGVYNVSGILKGSIVKYLEAIGYVTVYNISAFNATPPMGTNRSGASLQLNVVLQVNTNNESYQFWLQNVIDFITSIKIYYIEDNIWNFTSNISYLTNASVSGKGAVYYYKDGNFYYAYSTTYYNYTFPFSLILFTKLDNISRQGVTISFGYNNGTGIQWYDNVTIHVFSVRSAYLLIDGYNLTGNQFYYDLELVFAGQGNGEYTYFKSMNSSLGLQIILQNGTIISPNSLYTFGSDTEESADNLMVLFQNNYAWVLIGNNNFHAIGNASIPKLYLYPPVTNNNTSGYGSLISLLALIFLIVLIVLGIRRLRRR